MHDDRSCSSQYQEQVQDLLNGAIRPRGPLALCAFGYFRDTSTTSAPSPSFVVAVSWKYPAVVGYVVLYLR